MRIELVYENGCPNVAAARARLLRACAEVGVPPHWREWELGSPAAPSLLRGYGSPTILVDGRDVCGAEPQGDAICCRVYSHEEPANQGVPPMADIVSALESALDPLSRSEGGAG